MQAFLFLIFFSLPLAHSNSSFQIILPHQAKHLLGQYPAEGSNEFKHDFAVLLNYQETRTQEECLQAKMDDKATVRNLFARKDGPLTVQEAKRFSLKIMKAYGEAGINILIAKNVFKRPRPYLTNPMVKPCIELESSYAYPSGHTTISRVFARVLSEIYPDRAVDLLKRADEVATSRILGGVHHPSDVEAGKKLGDRIALKILKSQKLMDELISEI